MLTAEQIIREARSLPVEQRIVVVESLLLSLNAPDPEVQRQWLDVAGQRKTELESGAVAPVDGAEALERLMARLKT